MKAWFVGIAFLAAIFCAYWLGTAQNNAEQQFVVTAQPTVTDDSVREPDEGQPIADPAIVAAPDLPDPPPNVLRLLELPGDFDQTAGLYALAAAADAEEIRAQIRLVRQIDRDGDRQAAYGILFLRLAQLEPEAVIGDLYRLGDDDRFAAIYSLFSDWARFDLDLGVANLARLRDESDRRYAQRTMVTSLNGESPQEQHEVLRRVAPKDPALRSHALIMRARTDPAGALQEALSDQNADIAARSLSGIAEQWARLNPDSALQAAALIINANWRQQFEQAVMVAIVSHSPHRLEAMLGRADTSHSRQRLLHAAVSELAHANPDQAFDLMNSLPEDAWRRAGVGTVLTLISERSAADAARLLLRVEDRALMREYGPSVAHSYGRADPEAAIRWVQKLDDPSGQMLSMVVAAVATTDPERALAAIDQLPAGVQKLQLQGVLLTSMAQSDPQGAADAALVLPAGEVRRNVISQILNQWIQVDPDRALEFALTLKPQEQQAVLSGMAYSIANSDLDRAIAFTARLEGPVLREWVYAVVISMAHSNPYRAADFIVQYRDLPNYGDLVGQVAGSLVTSDPARAVALTESIDDPQQRERGLLRMIAHWARFDPQAAARWLDGNSQMSDRLDMEIVSRWAELDRAAAFEWIKSFEDPQRQDAAYATLLSHGASGASDVDGIIAAFNADQQRWQAVAQYARQIAQYSQNDARRFLDDWPLPAEMRNQLDQELFPGG